MVRSFGELIEWLGRDNHFPGGLILLTGTGIVPPDDFSLQAGDLVRITIDGIGTLENPVIQGPARTRKPGFAECGSDTMKQAALLAGTRPDRISGKFVTRLTAASRTRPRQLGITYFLSCRPW